MLYLLKMVIFHINQVACDRLLSCMALHVSVSFVASCTGNGFV